MKFNASVVVLLSGGDKNSQYGDIRRAKQLAKARLEAGNG